MEHGGNGARCDLVDGNNVNVAMNETQSGDAQVGRKDTWLTGRPCFSFLVNQQGPSARENAAYERALVDRNRETLSTRRNILLRWELGARNRRKWQNQLST